MGWNRIPLVSQVLNGWLKGWHLFANYNNFSGVSVDGATFFHSFQNKMIIF